MTNDAGFDEQQTLERVAELGKFTQEDAGYMPQAEDNHCQGCVFFLRPEDGNVGACKVVEGDINVSGSSQLYIPVKDDNEMHEDEEVMVDEESKEKAISSFSQFEAMQASINATKSIIELSQLYPKLVEGVMVDDAIEDKLGAIQNLSNEFESRTEKILRGTKERWQPLTDKVTEIATNLTSKQATKVEGGVKYIASDYAYVPDPEKPSTWKLRLAESESGNITVSQLGRAAAAFSPGGFRGNKVQIPQADVARVKSRIRREYKKLGVENVPNSVKELNSFTLLKQEDGSLRWLAVYSNNIIDDDNPPDILSAQAHKDFMEKCEKGEVPYPELWLWHVKEWQVGQTDAIVLSEQDNVTLALATGTVSKEAEPIFEKLGGMELGVSHGMHRDSIVRDKESPKVINEYVSKEISPLPLASAANKFTEFIVLEELNMLKEDKRQQLVEMGVPESALDKIEAVTLATSKEVDDKQLETKEEETPPQSDEQPPQTGEAQVVELITALGQRLTAIEAKLNDEIKELKETVGKTPTETLFGDVLKQKDPILEKGPEQTEPTNGNSQPFFFDWLQEG